MYNIETVARTLNQTRTLHQDLFNKWVAYLDLSKNSTDTYTKDIRHFINYLRDNNITSPTRQDILNYKQTLQDKGLKATTINGYIMAIKQFFNWTETEHLYNNIAKNIKGAKVSNEFKKDYLTPDQAKALLNSIDRTTDKGIRDYAIICLLITTGIRTIELKRAKIEDLRQNNTVLYIQGKGREDKAEYVKIAPETAKAIIDYLATRKDAKDTKPLFTSISNHNNEMEMTTRSISRIVKNHLINAGLKSDRLTAHSLRHTAGTLNLKAGGTLTETQQLLRHKSINTTMIYSHILDRENNNSEIRIANTIFNN